MKQEDIVALLSEYERSHAVEEYTAYGWHAWPVLRNLLGYRLAPRDEEDFASSGSLSLRRRKSRLEGVAGRLAADTLRRCGILLNASLGRGGRIPSPGSKGQDVVIVTSSTRVQPKGDALYHRLADPIVEAIMERHGQALVWERGKIRLPRHRMPAWISQPLRRRYLLDMLCGRFPPRLPELPWFAEYAAWSPSLLKAKNPGQELEDLRYVQAASQVFAGWLRASGCRVLMIDVWYDRETMAAILAARRLGILTVELQHGLHGFAYRGWTKAPAGGYEVFPDFFWVWGKDIARALLEANPGVLTPDRVIVGGNLWINKWRKATDEDLQRQVAQARQLSAAYDKAILVTLQKGVDLDDLLWPAIQASPPRWLWLLRLHVQSLDQLERFRAKAQSIGHPGVNLDEATRLPLYALFHAVHHHLTAFSTCALEALAFGVPTVIVHPTGRANYGKYLDAGVMQYADESADILRGLELGARVKAEDCLSAARSVFAPPEECRRTLDSLLFR